MTGLSYLLCLLVSALDVAANGEGLALHEQSHSISRFRDIPGHWLEGRQVPVSLTGGLDPAKQSLGLRLGPKLTTKGR